MNSKIISKLTSCALLGTMITYAVPVFAYTKDETIYSKLNSEGSIYNTIINNHIKNEDGLELINDLSDLLNIENENSEEKPEQDGNKLVWKANGEDVYYQGETTKELPIECKVRYELDGKIVEAKDIIGKSGKVKIVLEYINKDSHVVNINGKEENLYTPFTVICGTVIDNKTNKNIKISKGKVVDNGNKTIVIGMCLPGMQESLNISKGKIDIPSSIEITMDATNFELNNIMTYITPKIIEDTDLSIFDSMDEIYSKATIMQQSANKLEDGASKLSESATKLNNGTKQLSDTLNSKINQYENAKVELTNKDKIKEKIINFINEELEIMLPDLEEQTKIEAENVIKKHKAEIEDSVVETSLKYTRLAINEKLDEASKNGGRILTEEQEKQLKEALINDIVNAFKNAKNNPQIKSLLDELENNIKNETKNTVKSTINSKKINTATLAQEQINAYSKTYATQINQIKSINPEITDSQALQIIGVVSNSTLVSAEKEINSKIDKMSAENTSTTEQKIREELDKYITKIAQDVVNRFLSENSEIIKGYEEKIQKSIIEAIKQKLNQSEFINAYRTQIKSDVDATVNKISESTANDLSKEYTEKIVKEIVNNLIEKELKGELSDTEIDKEINKYESLIDSKLVELDKEIKEIRIAFNKLTYGTEQLDEGSKKFSTGMTKFNNEGIKKISNYINGELKDTTTRLQQLKELSEKYNNFSMLKDGNDGNVKFIMILDSLKKEQSSKQDIILNDNKEE